MHRSDRAPLLDRVLEVVNRHDPEGLLGLGAPADEYESEARALTAVLARGDAITVADVRQVWVHSFGAAPDSLTALARDLARLPAA
ncbi:MULTISPECIES: hypothetical protein [Actinosynnema]|uniref:hypothetical protein n=1 Tax=Actinosynnema TaxID=40566 RepID=UPI0020A3DA1A|nr:hypothetical protein [Actinosynnema pretiosum]MCP2093338.1 hypothetical protein [Actinosynnema pretiosum]